MATGRAYYEGGPKHDQLLLADDTPGQLMHFQGVGGEPGASYRMTDRTIDRNGTTYRVYAFVENPEESA